MKHFKRDLIILAGFILLLPAAAFASTQPNASTCSGTIIGTITSTSCSGSQDFPDDGSGNVPTYLTGSVFDNGSGALLTSPDTYNVATFSGTLPPDTIATSSFPATYIGSVPYVAIATSSPYTVLGIMITLPTAGFYTTYATCGSTTITFINMSRTFFSSTLQAHCSDPLVFHTDNEPVAAFSYVIYYVQRDTRVSGTSMITYDPFLDATLAIALFILVAGATVYVVKSFK